MNWIWYDELDNEYKCLYSDLILNYDKIISNVTLLGSASMEHVIYFILTIITLPLQHPQIICIIQCKYTCKLYVLSSKVIHTMDVQYKKNEAMQCWSISDIVQLIYRLSIFLTRF